ncbi:hypothetical protein AMK14_20845 [Streptomyces sp. TSRI0445]|nr:hypothetical protein AMK14_20845 [Streptomyces sp. TSRI0445]
MTKQSSSGDTVPTPVPHTTADAAELPDPKRWWALAVIAGAQLMVILDGTIVNIALPSVQDGLGMSDASRQWVITAYSLAFGGLLLLGGRIADLVGRKRTFLIGLVGFAAASALGGAADGPGTLFAARALQGACAAVLAPSALSLLTTVFTDPAERGTEPRTAPPVPGRRGTRTPTGSIGTSPRRPRSCCRAAGDCAGQSDASVISESRRRGPARQQPLRVRRPDHVVRSRRAIRQADSTARRRSAPSGPAARSALYPSPSVYRQRPPAKPSPLCRHHAAKLRRR